VVDDAADRPIAGWARAWLALQVAAGFLLPAWLLLRDVAAMQAGLG
jgi:hypothetical protein